MEFDDQVKDALSNIRKAVGKKIKYQRGSNFTYIKVARGNTYNRYDAQDNVRMLYEEKEFLVGANDLMLGGNYVKPQRGDQIIEEYGTKKYTYIVIQASGSDDVWAWSDSGKSTYRVFTKLDSETNV